VKVEAAGPPDTLVSFYQTLHCHIQKTVVLKYTNIEFLFRHVPEHSCFITYRKPTASWLSCDSSLAQAHGKRYTFIWKLCVSSSCSMTRQLFCHDIYRQKECNTYTCLVTSGPTVFLYVSVVRRTLSVCLLRGRNFESYSGNWLVSCYCRFTGYFILNLWNWYLFSATQGWRQSQLLKCFHPMDRIKLNSSLIEVYFISL